MTTTINVQVPQGASYVARVTTTHLTAEGSPVQTFSEDVQPGGWRQFYASSSCSILVEEAPIPAVQVDPPAREPEPA